MIQIIVDALHPSITETGLLKPWWSHIYAKGQAQALADSMGLRATAWVLLSPVLIHNSHNDSLIVDVLKDDKAFDSLRQFVEQDGFILHRYDETLWLLGLPHHPDFKSASVFEAYHQSLKPYLDVYPSTWRLWMTEVQMLFKAAGVAAQGVWMWGQGPFLPVQKIWVYPALQDLGVFAAQQILWSPGQKLEDGAILWVAQDCASEIETLIGRQKYDIEWFWRNHHYSMPRPSILNIFRQWYQHGN